jgi:hypothetical protein
MKYVRAYQFIFDSPKWMMNVLLAGACLIIPIIGPLILLGYAFEIVETMHRNRSDAAYPDFNFDKFGNYLMRGLWPALVHFCVIFPLLLLSQSCSFLAMLAGLGRGSDLVSLLFLPVFIAAGIAMVPLALRAGFLQDFRAAFAIDFVKDFVRKMWQETIIAWLFLIVTGSVLAFVGLLMCLVGIFPAMAVFGLAQMHLFYQLYELYLERGGMRIPLPGEQVDTAPPGAQAPV